VCGSSKIIFLLKYSLQKLSTQSQANFATAMAATTTQHQMLKQHHQQRHQKST
jgi:hypothetical protein